MPCAGTGIHSVPREDDMSETRNEYSPADEHDDDSRRQEMAEVQEKLDAQSDGDGVAAEAGRGEDTGLAEAERPLKHRVVQSSADLPAEQPMSAPASKPPFRTTSTS